MQGSRVGHVQIAVRPVNRDGRPLVEIDSSLRLTIQRFDQPTEMSFRQTGLETPDGRLIEYSSVLKQGTAAMTTEGRVAGDKLNVKVTTTGKTLAAAIPWSADIGGLYAIERSLLDKPMGPGETRAIRALEPTTNQVADNKLTAGVSEAVKLLGETKELLRIDIDTTLGGQTIKNAVWTDASGEIWKRWSQPQNTEFFRTTKEIALAKVEPGKFDLGWDIAVPVSRRLENPHATKKVRYRVQLNDGDSAKVFPSGSSQQVRSTGEHSAEITVWAVRPDVPGNPESKEAGPTDADRSPGSLIQSDHPKVVEAAQQGAKGLSDPWRIAVALEWHAEQLITKSGYAQAFDTAADALASGAGDCTEHAVLLAAMARARKIPARVAVGLVYKDKRFLYHMWTEVFIDGRWIPLDATLARGGIGAAHLKLGHSSLDGPSPWTSMLAVAQVAGQLKVEILDVE